MPVLMWVLYMNIALDLKIVTAEFPNAIEKWLELTVGNSVRV